MRHLMLATISAVLVAAPALADPPKEKKVCHAVNNGNPMFPQMKCKTVPIEASPAATASQTVATPTPVAAAATATTTASDPAAMTAANTVAPPK